MEIGDGVAHLDRLYISCYPCWSQMTLRGATHLMTSPSTSTSVVIVMWRVFPAAMRCESISLVVVLEHLDTAQTIEGSSLQPSGDSLDHQVQLSFEQNATVGITMDSIVLKR
jgi:hypothetical protein